MADNKQFEVKFVIQALDQAGAILTSIRSKLQGIGSTAQQVGTQASQAGGQIAIGLKQAEQAADAIRNKLDSIGQSLIGMGISMTAVGGGLLAPVAIAAKSAGDFEHAMNKVRAVANMTPEDFQKVTKFAQEMGATTVFSANQAAGGLLEISRAGYDAKQAMATLPTVLQLAAAEEQNAGEVAEGLINILNGFSLKAEDASRAGDVLSRTSNDTTTSMRELTEAFKFVGPIASTVGMSLEQTAASLGVLSNNGIKGSEAGTGLRRMIERLSDPTAEARNALARLGVEIARQADGNVNLSVTFDRLRAAGMTAKDAFSIFGIYGATSAVVLAKNREEVEKLTKSNQAAAGSLKEMTNIATSGMNAALTKLSNAFDELVKTLGAPFTSAVKTAADWLANLINWVSATAKEWPKLSTAFGVGLAVLGGAGVILGAVITVLGGLFLAVNAASRGWGALGQIKQFVTGIIGRSSQAIRESTAVLQANTQAITANAQAQRTASLVSRQNQDIIDRLNVPYAGRGAPQPKSTTVPMPGQQPGSGGALGWKLMADGGAKATVVMAGLSTVLSTALNPQLNTMGDALVNTGTTLGTLALNIGVLGPVMGTIATGFSSWVQVVPLLGEAFSFLKTDLEELVGPLDAILEKVNPLGAMIQKLVEMLPGGSKGIPSKALSKEDFLPGAEAFVSDQQMLAQINGQVVKSSELLVLYKQRWAEANPGKSFPKEAEEAFQRAFFNIVSTVKGALDKVGTEYEQLNKQSVPIRTLDQQIGDVKAKYDIELKTLDSTTKQKQALLKQEEEQTRAALTGSIQSEQYRASAIQAAELAVSANRIQIARQSYAETVRLKEAEIAELKALYTKQAAEQSDKAGEANQKLIELDKQQTELRIAEGQKLTDAINQELDKQLQKKTEYEKKIQDLGTQSLDVQKNTSEALRQLQVGAASEYDALKMKLSDAHAKLKQATDLMPTFPERAMKLAQEAQQAFAGLGQQLNALQNNMKTNAQAVADAQRAVATSGLTGAQKFYAQVQDIQTTVARAREAQLAGQTEEAEAFYKQALSQAQGLGSSGDVGKPQAQATAQNLIAGIGQELLALNQGQIDTAKQYQEQATQGVKDAGQLQLDGIKNQIDATKALIVALNENTQALLDQKNETLTSKAQTGRQPEGGVAGNVPSSGTGKTPGTGGAAPLSPLQRSERDYGDLKRSQLTDYEHIDSATATIGKVDSAIKKLEEKGDSLSPAEQEQLSGLRDKRSTLGSLRDFWQTQQASEARMGEIEADSRTRLQDDDAITRSLRSAMGIPYERAYEAASARKQALQDQIAGTVQGKLSEYQEAGSKGDSGTAGGESAEKLSAIINKFASLAPVLDKFSDALSAGLDVDVATNSEKKGTWSLA